VYMMLVDIRTREFDVREPALTRSEGGGMVYMQSQKKALIQSLPYLPLLLVPIFRLCRREDESNQILALLIVPITYVLFVSHRNDHGGMCLNMRYFLPILPFSSILCAYAVRDYYRRYDLRMSFVTLMLIASGTAAVFFALLERSLTSVNDQEFPFLDVPIAIGAILAILIILNETLRTLDLSLVRKIVSCLLVMTMAWASLTAFFYDYPRHRRQRVLNYEIGRNILNVVPPDSLVFTYPYIDPVLRLIEQDRVRIAFPGFDDFRDFSRLLEYNLSMGRHVFGVFLPQVWNNLQTGPLASYQVEQRMILGYARVCEIFRKERFLEKERQP
jgi:hypothetical protein